MTLAEILHGSAYSLELFTNLYDNAIQRLEERIKVKTNKKGVDEPFVTCIVRDKEIKLTPEEVVRQLYAERLMTEYGYPKERLVFEYPVYFGRETKRADIVIKDKGVGIVNLEEARRPSFTTGDNR